MSPIIWINEKEVPVSDKIYYAFMRPVWREKKRALIRASKEESLDALVDNGYDPPADQALIEEIVEDQMQLELLRKALAELTGEERSIVDALFFDGKSEREVSKETGIPRKTISYRRDMALKKLRKLFLNEEQKVSPTCPLTFL